MGGLGSGRPPQNRLSNSYKQVTVRKLQQTGALEPGQVTSWQWTERGQVVTFAGITAENTGLQVLYSWWSVSEDWVCSNWFLRLDKTNCNYGGSRPWLLCPTPGCQRRMYILYGDRDIACRTCRHLSYPSQRVAPPDRFIYRSQKLRLRLGGTADTTLPFPPKPAGMPSFTYTKLGLRAHRAEVEAGKQLIDTYKHIPSKLSPVGETSAIQEHGDAAQN